MWLCPTFQCRSVWGRWILVARRSLRRARWTSRWQTVVGGDAARCWTAPQRPRTTASLCGRHGNLVIWSQGVNMWQNKLRLNMENILKTWKSYVLSGSCHFRFFASGPACHHYFHFFEYTHTSSVLCVGPPVTEVDLHCPSNNQLQLPSIKHRHQPGVDHLGWRKQPENVSCL